MKTRIVTLILLVLIAVAAPARKKQQMATPVYSYGVEKQGTTITLTFEKGKEHNHPLFAIWLADENGRFVQTLYVSQTIGRGVFAHGSRKAGQWMPGEIQRPATVPYWAHQRAVLNEYGTYLPTPRQPVADAYTGATPPSSFVMKLRTDKPLRGKYKLMLELNQSWDWNEYWYNDRFPGDKEYQTSSQPAVVYVADIDTEQPATVELRPLGYSHYAGKDGSLNTNLSTITTALQIADKITATIDK